MNRRNFLKNSLLALGALSLPGTGGLSALTRESTAAGPVAAGPGNAPDPANRTFRRSVMWGMVGSKGSPIASYSVLDKCKAIKAAGFDGIEPYSHMDRAEVLDAMRQTGLVASSVCNAKHWGAPLSSPDPKVRREGMKALVYALEDAKAYGTDAVLLVPGIVNKEVSYDQCWARSTACIREVLPEAQRLGVKIGIENVWNHFLMSPLETARYIDQFDSPMVGCYFDVGNILAFGWPEQWIDILGERIVRIHIKDYSRKLADSQGPGSGFQVPLGEGENDWPAIMAALRRHYRSDWLTIEHAGGDTPEGLVGLEQALERIIRS